MGLSFVGHKNDVEVVGSYPTLVTVEKLYSHVAVDTSIVKAAAYNE